MSNLAKAHLRVARPTNDLSETVKFYRDGLGFEILYEFRDHDGFDGVMLGHAGAAYHLEFTHKHGHAAGKAPTQDNLLVFYIPDPGEWAAIGATTRKSWPLSGRGIQPLLGQARKNLRGSRRLSDRAAERRLEFRKIASLTLIQGKSLYTG